VNDKRNLGIALAVGVTLLAAGLVCLARPGYVSNIKLLGAVIVAEIVIASIWHFEKTFFVLLMLSFLLAGLNTPLLEAGLVLRWVVLGVGAAVGYIKWMKAHREPFGAFHLAALFCIFAALTSAMVSAIPQMALLKALSLVLMFLYGAAGARLAIMENPEKFINGLVLGCEITVWCSVLCYFGLHYEIFGNPNALGAVMGIVVTPIMFWATLSADSRFFRQRRFVSFVACWVLLYHSGCRAGIIAGFVSVTIACIILGRQKLLVKAAFYLILALAIVGVVAPEEFEDFTSSLATTLIYKSKLEQGVFGSRKSPWQQTISVIREHPWFGSGFGTSDLGASSSELNLSSVYTREETGREHGSSYLAMLEWLGLLGVVPFLALLLFLVLNIIRVHAWMAHSRSVMHYGVPIAMVLTAGLVHAIFEDWLLAVGFYLTVFFWALAFILNDLVAANVQVPAMRCRLGRPIWHSPPAPTSS
jgi:O-antigen ligase